MSFLHTWLMALGVSRTLGRAGAWLTFGIGDHWFRRHPGGTDFCLERNCGRPGWEHWQFVGEWVLPGRSRRRLIRHRAVTRLKRRWQR